MTSLAYRASSFRARVLRLKHLTLRTYSRALEYPFYHHKGQHYYQRAKRLRQALDAAVACAQEQGANL